jgi:hypothetical protein
LETNFTGMIFGRSSIKNVVTMFKKNQPPFIQLYFSYFNFKLPPLFPSSYAPGIVSPPKVG